MTEHPQSKSTFSLGVTIRRRRDQRGISLRSLASTLGVNRGYLSKLESDAFGRPSLAILQKVAKALDLSFTTLVARSGHKLPTDLPSMADYLAQTYDLDQVTARKLAKQFQKNISDYLETTTEKEV